MVLPGTGHRRHYNGQEAKGPHNWILLQFAWFGVGAAWYCTGGMVIAMAVLAALIPAHFQVAPTMVPILDVQTVPYGSVCPEGFKAGHAIDVPTQLDHACVCPPSAHLYANSMEGPCDNFHLHHGCVDAHAPTHVPVWEPTATSMLCIRKAGTVAVAVVNDTVRARSTYDPDDPTTSCSEGFRKCGRGFCFDVGVPCPLTAVSFTTNGSVVREYTTPEGDGGPDGGQEGNRGFLTDLRFVRVTERDDHQDNGQLNNGQQDNHPLNPQELLASVSRMPSSALESLGWQPLPFACGPGDLLCDAYAGHLDQSPILPDQPMWVFQSTTEPPPLELECLSRVGTDPSALPLLAPKLFLLFLAAWSLLNCVFSIIGYAYIGSVSCCPPRSMASLLRRLRCIGLVAFLSMGPVLWYLVELVRQTKAYRDVPNCAYFGDGSNFALALYVMAVLCTAIVGMSVMWTVYSHVSSGCWLDTGGDELLRQERKLAEEAKLKKAEEKSAADRAKRTQRAQDRVKVHVSNMSPDEQAAYRAELGLPSPTPSPNPNDLASAPALGTAMGADTGSDTGSGTGSGTGLAIAVMPNNGGHPHLV